MAKNKRTSAPADVRAWALSQGIAVGSRGRFNPSLVTAFNKAHKGAPYAEATYVETVTVKATRRLDNGRAVPVSARVHLPAARAAAIAAGVNVGARGRMPSDVLQAYVTGTLATAPLDRGNSAAA